MPRMKKITLQLIADELGVSKALVSKALSNNSAVNEMTKETIWRTAEKMGYRMKVSRHTTPASGTGNLAALMPRAYLDDMEYWGKVIHGMEKELAAHSFSMILSSIDTSLPPKEGLLSSINEKGVDGAVVMGHFPDSYMEALMDSGTPLIMVNANLRDSSIDHVLANDFLGAYQATSYLLACGHRRLGFIGDTEMSWSFRERGRGFEEAIRDFTRKDKGNAAAVMIDGIGMNETGIYMSADFSRGLGRQVKTEQPVTGLFCANDLIAVESLKLLHEWKISCPDQISVIGFDDLSLAEIMTPKLTTVRVPKADIGARAAQMIMRRIEDGNITPEHVLLSTRLIKRASVGNNVKE